MKKDFAYKAVPTYRSRRSAEKGVGFFLKALLLLGLLLVGLVWEAQQPENNRAHTSYSAETINTF